MNKNKYLMITAIVIITIWMVMKYMEGRKFRENYEMNKDGLLEYIENDKINPIDLMNRVMKLTDDEEIVKKMYELAKAGDIDNLTKTAETL